MKVVYVHSNSSKDVRVLKEIDALFTGRVVESVKILYWERLNTEEESITIAGHDVQFIKFERDAKFGSGLKKNLFNRISFFRFVFKWLVQHRSEYDTVHVVNFELALLVLMTRIFVRGKKYVYDIFDYIADGYGYNLPQIVKSIIRKLNKLLVKHADLTIVASKKRMSQILIPVGSNVIVIENAPNSIKIPKVGRFHISNAHPNVLKLVYVGVLTQNRYLVEVAKIVNADPTLELFIGGFGGLEDQIKKISEHSDNVHFLGRMEYQDVLFLESQADVMLALYSLSIPNHVYAAPNKFYEAMFLGKPLLMIQGSGMSEYVSKYKIGMNSNDSVDGIVHALDQLKLNYEQIASNAKNCRGLYDREFSWQVMAKRLQASYESLDKKE